MRVEKVYRSILKTVGAYQQALNRFGPANFQIEPPIGGWSFSEVYCHILDSSLLSLIALNNCIRGEGTTKPTALTVKLILFFGMFPPGIKYKAPPKIATRVKKISVATAQQFMIDFEFQFAQTYLQIKQANPEIKIKHPVIGYLNATQWMRFIEIHLKHHLKQLKRIENSFRQ